MQRTLTLLALIGVAPLQAQDGVPWRASYYPYVISSPSTGFMGVGHFHLARQADYDRPAPFDGILSAEAGIGGRRSWFAAIKFRGPQLTPGWRYAADAGVIQEGSFGYFGEGPRGESASHGPIESRPEPFFHASRRREFLRAEVTRQIAGPLHVAGALGLTKFRYVDRDGSGLFSRDRSGDTESGTDLSGRFTVVLDTRDKEFVPNRGLLLEAGVYLGSSSYRQSLGVLPDSSHTYMAVDGGFTGLYANLRGYLSPRQGTTIAARLVVRELSDKASLDLRYSLPGWERETSVLGGVESHRSFVPGRFVGRSLNLANLEVRHNLLDVGDYGAVTLLAFTDAGRVSEGSFGTLSRWRVGGGGGLALRVLRTTVLTFNFAGGPDGFQFTMGNGWSF
ncbi:MAG: BamA/TamA family outer membrane protein [Gemmatimonadales bacterium]|nr:BamA/TamA family outer membrane protein [Gemmatimonadales bacterium]